MPDTTTKKAAGKFDRNSELRIRNFSKKHKAELQEIMKVTRKPFESYAVEYLIENFRSDQALIKQLQSRNYDLHTRLGKLVERENAVKNLLQSFLQQQAKWDKLIAAEGIKLLKQFSGTVRRPKSKISAINKKVSQKKGGEK